MVRLAPTMTLEQFDRGYFYAGELREFADRLGVPSARRLRKDELERAIRSFLSTGKIARGPKRPLVRTGVKDVERGLRLDLPIVTYTNDEETKDFLERAAKERAPGYRRRSGARYRLNRWREEQIARGRTITYGDLVEEYVRLSMKKEPFARIPHGRYINFVADFLAGEPNATREAAVRAWRALKRLDIPKDYSSWRTHHSRRRRPPSARVRARVSEREPERHHDG